MADVKVILDPVQKAIADAVATVVAAVADEDIVGHDVPAGDAAKVAEPR